MERLSSEILLIIIEQALYDPTLEYFSRIELMVSLPLVNKQLRWVYFYKVSLDVRIPSRAYYQYWISKLESLPRAHPWNTRCRSFEFIVEYSREAWFSQNFLKDRLGNADPIPYFMGNILTRKGLFPNLRTIHIRFGAAVGYDPYNLPFPACLPRSVNALYLHYHVPKHMGGWKSGYFGKQHTLKTILRYTPVRFSTRKHPLEALIISVTGDEVQDENTGPDATHYTDVPIFRDIARLWGSLVDATPRLFIQGILRPIEIASQNVTTLDMNEALEFYREGQPLEEIGWDWHTRGPESWRSSNQSQGLKKKHILGRLIQKFVALPEEGERLSYMQTRSGLQVNV